MIYEGEINSCVGLHFIWNHTQKWLMIMQETYLQDVFVHYNMSNCNLVLASLRPTKII
jgi:hypothetical protein